MISLVHEGGFWPSSPPAPSCMTATTTKVRGKEPQASSQKGMAKCTWLLVFKDCRDADSREAVLHRKAVSQQATCNLKRFLQIMNGPPRGAKALPPYPVSAQAHGALNTCPGIHRVLYATGTPQCHLQLSPSSKGCQVLENSAPPEAGWVISGCLCLLTTSKHTSVST